MPFDPVLLEQLLKTFRSELEEQLQAITNGLIELEKNETSDIDKNIEAVLRYGHNIKGTSASLGIKDVSAIAHRIESIFSLIKKKEISISPEIIDICLEAVDKIRLAMNAFVEKTPLTFDLESVLEMLDKRSRPKIEAAANLPKEELSKIEEPIAPKEKSAKSEEPIVPKEQLAPKPVKKTQHDKTVGASNVSQQEKSHLSSDSIRISIENLDRVSYLIEEIQVNKIAINDHYADFNNIALDTDQLLLLWKKLYLILKTKFINQIDEPLQKLCNTFMDGLLEVNADTQKLHTNMQNRMNELMILSNSLQEEVRTLRLIPAAFIFQTLPRAVRDIAQAMNKKINFIIRGDETKMDKLLLEGLRDPIIHLLRNAIDHGIEDPEVRKKKGKPEEGRIEIDIKEEDNKIFIIIADDGAGINSEKIAEVAERNNLFSKEELDNMSEAEILNLIFLPGFSTRSIITDISGRGVGLDAVKTNISHLKGNISISTEPDKGTVFTLQVPLTLSSERGLVLKSGGELFVIPLSSIEHIININADDVVNIEDSRAIVINDHPIPLCILADVLQIERNEPITSENLPALIVYNDKVKIVLLVEEIIGEREILVKPIQEPLTNMDYVAGGTLAGNGQVIMVLNPSSIINKALHSSKGSFTEVRVEKMQKKATPHILVADDSITTRTLEKNILESKGYQVTVAVDGKEAWEFLQKRQFSLLITDVNMPNMDGFALTERVKKHENLRHLPVIIVTSLGSPSEKKRGIEVGAEAYIVKNEFESGALLEIVGQLV